MNKILKNSFDKLFRQLLVSGIVRNHLKLFLFMLITLSLFLSLFLLIIKLSSLEELDNAHQVNYSSRVKLSKHCFQYGIFKLIPRFFFHERVLAWSTSSSTCLSQFKKGLHKLSTDKLALGGQILSQTLQS